MSFVKAGVGRADITPLLGTLLAGYPRERPAKDVLDPLTVTALALEAGETRSLILSICGIVATDELTEQIRASVNKVTGWDKLQINVCMWHTHTAPHTFWSWGWGDVDHPYCDNILVPGCVEAAKLAVADIGEVTVGIGTTSCDAGVNRRQVLEDGSIDFGQNPWGPYDPTMTAIRFLRDGKPYANIIHYGTHATAIGSSFRVSRDWPGIMVDRVEELIGGMTLFLNGAIGDVGPRPSDGTTGATEENLREVGHCAAQAAIRACKEIKYFVPMELEVLVDDITFVYRPLPDKATAEKMFVLARENRGDGWGMQEAEYKYWEAVLGEITCGNSKSSDMFTQTITRIGPVAIVPFPGEPFSEISLRLRQYSPIQHTLAVSCSNGNFGYITTRDALHRGGYEAESRKMNSPYFLAENIDDVLIQENLRLLRKMKV